MKKYNKYFAGLYLALSLSSCGYLDIVPDNTVTIESMWADRYTAERALGTLYASLPPFGNYDSNVAFIGSAEMTLNNEKRWSGIGPYQISRSLNNATSNYINVWEGEWGMYSGIRRCNDFLDGVDQVKDLQLFQRQRMKAEATMLKAYMHFYLLRFYGPICPMRTNSSIEGSTEDNKIYREKVDDCFQYIIDLLDEVIEGKALPTIINSTATELGRLTQPAAYFLKARVLLTWASPLFNGNTDYVDFLNHEGEPFFNQVENTERWREAAQACEEAIASCAEGGIRLYQFNDYKTRGNLSDETHLVCALRSAVTERWNTELVWGATNSPIGENLQKISVSRFEAGDGGQITDHTMGAPFNTVNLFYTKNGLPIDQDKDYYQDGIYTVYKYDRTNEEFNAHYDFEYNKHYVIVDEYNAGMNFDREPRFYSTFAFNRGVWFGNYYKDPSDDKDVEITNNTYAYLRSYFGEFSSVVNNDFYNPTGYFMKKLVSLETVQSGPDRWNWYNYPYPEMRYADLLLMAAEAWNEVEGPTTRVTGYLNQIRERAGLETLETTYQNYAKPEFRTYYQNKENMREVIRRERKIELCGEAHAFWDERRWKTAETNLNRSVQGWNVLGKADDDSSEGMAREYYIPTVLFTQEFTYRDYFAPIPDWERQKNPKLVQNPGW